MITIFDLLKKVFEISILHFCLYDIISNFAFTCLENGF